MGTTTVRVSVEHRDKLMKIAADDYGGATVDETLRRLMREHEAQSWIAQSRRLREQHPDQWSEMEAELVGIADGVVGDLAPTLAALEADQGQAG